MGFGSRPATSHWPHSSEESTFGLNDEGPSPLADRLFRGIIINIIIIIISSQNYSKREGCLLAGVSAHLRE